MMMTTPNDTTEAQGRGDQWEGRERGKDETRERKTRGRCDKMREMRPRRGRQDQGEGDKRETRQDEGDAMR